MPKVVPFERPGKADLVAEIKALLERAESGSITSLICVSKDTLGDFHYVSHVDGNASAYELVGVFDVLKAKAREPILDSIVDSDA